MGKRLAGFLYCVILMKPFHKITYTLAQLRERIEKGYLMFCMNGCENCYKWKCAVRDSSKTPYRKFRRGKFEWEK